MKKSVINKLALAVLPLALLAGCKSPTQYGKDKPQEPTAPPVYVQIESMHLIPENKTGFGASTANGGWAAYICYSLEFTFNQDVGVYQMEMAVPYTNLTFGAYPLPLDVPGTLLDWPITNTVYAPKTLTIPVPPGDVQFFRLRRLSP